MSEILLETAERVRSATEGQAILLCKTGLQKVARAAEEVLQSTCPERQPQNFQQLFDGYHPVRDDDLDYVDRQAGIEYRLKRDKEGYTDYVTTKLYKDGAVKSVQLHGYKKLMPASSGVASQFKFIEPRDPWDTDLTFFTHDGNMLIEHSRTDYGQWEKDMAVPLRKLTSLTTKAGYIKDENSARYNQILFGEYQPIHDKMCKAAKDQTPYYRRDHERYVLHSDSDRYNRAACALLAKTLEQIDHHLTPHLQKAGVEL